DADRGGRLAFAGRGRIDRSDEDKLAVGPVRKTIEKIKVDLRDVAAIRMERRLGNSEFGRNCPNRLERRRSGDFDICHHLAFSGSVLGMPPASYGAGCGATAERGLTGADAAGR